MLDEGAGLGGVAARLEGTLEDRLRGLPTGRNTDSSYDGGASAEASAFD